MSTTMQSKRLDDERLDRVFRALGDRTRRSILGRLKEGPAKVSDLARPYAMSLPAVGKHLRMLERAGLVRRDIEGRVHHCSLSPMPMRDAEQWMDQYRQFWEETLSALSDHLQKPSQGG